MEYSENKNRKKMKFIIRQLKLLADKYVTPVDNCFAVESFPRCSYEQLREVLVLPSKRKMQSVISGVDVDKVLAKVLRKLTKLKKNALLIIDEVKIRSSVAFSGGVMNEAAKNDPDSMSIIDAVRDAEMLA